MLLETFTYTAERGREMIEISELLSGSELGNRTHHNILLHGKRIGCVDFAYLQKGEVKTFRWTKRKLRSCQPFGVHLFIDAVQGGITADDLGSKGVVDLVDTVKARLKGLDDREYPLLELGKIDNTPIGRASNLTVRQ